jgi:hypothetical protein
MWNAGYVVGMGEVRSALDIFKKILNDGWYIYLWVPLGFKGLSNFVKHFLDVKKSKAVPLHAMEALGGRGDIAPTHSRPRH